MKKIRMIFLVFIMSIAVLLISACSGGGSTKLPVTKYDKVKYAFNGVEKSFKNPKAYQSSSKSSLELLSFNPTNSELDIIKNSYTREDNQGDKIDDLEYDQPPMIQFQCLKKVFEKVKEDYQFGIKYYDEIKNSIYVDMENGKDMSDETNKNDYIATYSFILALDINIDDNDLITADICFDISVSQGNNTYNTSWYVNLILDYDMNETNPNYTLTMLTNNEEIELPSRNGYTYEYDYVEVKDNKIKEWRKFCFEVNEKLVKDSTHSSFNDYINDNLKYDTGTCKWYYNNSLYKFTKNDKERSKTIANVFYNIGLNSTDIDGSSFINKTGEKNNAVTTIYNDFSNIFKKDIIYFLLTSEERKESGEDNTIAGIKYMNDDLSGGLGNVSIKDRNIGDLITQFKDVDDVTYNPQIYYVNSSEDLLYKVNINDLKIYFTIENETDFDNFYSEIEVNRSDLISNAYYRIMKQNNVVSPSNVFKIILKDEALNVSGETMFIYSGEYPTINNNVFPTEAISYGIPEYEGSFEIDFEYVSETNQKLVKIHNSNSEEANTYLTIISKAYFNLSSESTTNVKEYTKDKSDTEILHLRFDYSNSNEYQISAWIEAKQPDDPGDNPGGGEEEIIITSVSIVGSFNNWSVNDGCIDLMPREEENFFMQGVHLNSGDKFKIIANHSWDINYGYSDIDGIDSYSKYFSSEGTEENIVVSTECSFDILFTKNGDNVVIGIKNVKNI